ncbi:MAG: pyruvate ferredoxin oxidoreductase [Prevotella sp.]|nr:pyruvate ferredoxin oxidoreductase [Prevotella sp.]
MDYKYIEQLVERYFAAETSLEEEEILRAFFAQEDIPAELRGYAPLFAYEHAEKGADILGEEFDEKMLSLIGDADAQDARRPRARIVSLRERLMPLFKSAAVIAIILTLGNAAQVAFQEQPDAAPGMAEVQEPTTDGKSVALSDSVSNSIQLPAQND